MLKTCSKCQQTKDISLFVKNPKNKDGYSTCKACRKIVAAAWYAKNREHALKVSRNWKVTHPEHTKAYYHKHNREYYIKNKAKLNADCLKYYELHKKEISEWSANYYIQNKIKILKAHKVYVKKKYAISKQFRIYAHVRNRIRVLLTKHNVKKSLSTERLLGCSIPFLKIWLEAHFKEGMSWDNYGTKGWHIDHIRPCASFDLTKISQQKECFNYNNLRPLWWIDNLRKNQHWIK